MNHFFSIIIPVYNRGHMARASVMSALEQDYDQFEVIVVDDGSTDDTVEILSQINDPRLKIISKKNEERSVARNFGFSVSKGHYISFLDSDDRLDSKFCSEMNVFINAHHQPTFVQADYYVHDEDQNILYNSKLKGKNLNSLTLKGNYISCIGHAFRRDVFESLQFNTDPDLICTEDWDLMLKLSVRHEMFHLNKNLAYVLEHKNRSTNSFNVEKFDKRTQALLRSLKSDKVFYTAKHRYLRRINAHMYSYTALYAALDGNKKSARKFLSKSLQQDPRNFFTRRFFAIVKRIIR